MTAPRPCAKECILWGSVRGCFSPGVTCGHIVVAAVLVLSFAHGGCISRSLLSKGLARCSQPDAQHLPEHRDDRTERRRSFFFRTDVNGCENLPVTFFVLGFRVAKNLFSFFFLFFAVQAGLTQKINRGRRGDRFRLRWPRQHGSFIGPFVLLMEKRR